VFIDVNNCKSRYRVLKGSAGSGKSYNIVQDYVLKLCDPQYRGANLMVVRKIAESNRYSTYAEFCNAISRIFKESAQSFWHIKDSTMEITNKLTGCQVIFMGMKDHQQREKTKSVAFPNGKLTWIWCEEATQFESQDLYILEDRLRGKIGKNLFYQMTLSFNPINAQHHIKKRFFDSPCDEYFLHHSTYRDNEFMDKSFYEYMERRKIEDPEGYRVYGLGEWGEEGGLIFTKYEVKDFPTDYIYFDEMIVGQDFGYNHANAILLVGFKDNRIFVCDEYYHRNLDMSEIIKIVSETDLDPSLTMLCDAAEPDRINMWKTAGYNARACTKHSGSLVAQIEYLKKHKLYIHPKCENLIKELQQYKWKKDKQTNEYLDEPINFFDDAIAALRYAVSEKTGQEPAGSWDGAADINRWLSSK